jgi:cysteinyl-tRNA synthetase
MQPAGQRFVKYWLHGAHLLVEGRKMSKSLGNFFTVRDLLAKGFTGREIRYLLLTAHYRETFNFTLNGLQGARTALARIDECLSRLIEFWDDSMGHVNVQPHPDDSKLLEQFRDALDDDLNVSKAWGVIFAWIRDLNRAMSAERLSRDRAASALGTWKQLDRLLGLNLQPRSALRMSEAPQGIVPSGFLVDIRGEEEAPEEIKHLLMQRIQARKAKDFKQADWIRDQLKTKGWVIEDTPKGPKLKKL